MPDNSGFDRAKLSPEERERLAELCARLREKILDLGIMTTRQLLAKYPAVARGGTGDLEPRNAPARTTSGEVEPG